MVQKLPQRFGFGTTLLVWLLAWIVPVAAQQAVLSPQGNFIQSIGDKAMAIAANNQLTQEAREAEYSKLLQGAFDMPTIARFVIGRNWQSMNTAQQQEFMRLFEDLILRTYGSKLAFYSGETFQVTGSRVEDERDTIVNSEIVHQTATPPTRIDWRVRQRNEGPKVLDVMVEGVSQSVTLRQEYSSLIQRDGVEGLLATMRQRLAMAL